MNGSELPAAPSGAAHPGRSLAVPAANLPRPPATGLAIWALTRVEQESPARAWRQWQRPGEPG